MNKNGPQQKLDDVVVPILGGDLNGIHSIVSSGVDVGSGLDEVVDDIKIVLDDGFKKDRVKRRVSRIDVGASFN